MAKVLLFQCGNEMEIRQALTPMKISVASVPAEHFYLTLGELEKGGAASAASSRRGDFIRIREPIPCGEPYGNV